MFVRDFVHLDRCFQDVAPRFVGGELDVGAMVGQAVAAAGTHLPPGVPTAALDEPRFLRSGVRARWGGLVLSVRTLAESDAVGPASLNGELQVLPMGRMTELGFDATFRLPLGLDPSIVAGTRQATELAVRSFLRALSAELDAAV
jgi:hypothetical protein